MGRWSGKSCRLSTMLVMTASFFFIEMIVGQLTNSIALVTDSFHMASDVFALIVGFASVTISKWKTKRNTYGWQRAEVLGALVNSVCLVALCFSIVIESLKRLITLEEVESPQMLLIVGSLGLVINIIGLFLFGHHGHSHGGGGHGHGHSHGGDNDGHSHLKESEGHSHADNSESHSHEGHGHSHGGHGHSHGGHEHEKGEDNEHETVRLRGEAFSKSPHSTSSLDTENEVYTLDGEAKTEVVTHSGAENLNMRGVFLHVMADALGSVVVVISALGIMYIEGDWKYYLDPGMSIVMVIIILSSTIPLFKETSYILLQTVPRHVDVEAIIKELKEIDGIAGVHECHIWQLAGRRIIASAHIHCHNIQEYMSLANKIKAVFHKAGIHSTTIQPEFIQMEESLDKTCSLVCGTDNGDKCEQDTCCPPPKAGKNGVVPFEGANNSNSNDVARLLPVGEQSDQPPSARWNVDIEMSPEGDEVVLDMSRTE